MKEILYDFRDSIAVASVSIFNIVVVFFTPIGGIILLVAISTIIDTFFGIFTAKKNNIPVTSKKARHGLLPKLLTYISVIMLVYASDYFILNDLTTMVVSASFLSTKLMSLVLLAIEVKSIDENFKKIYGWSFLNRIKEIILKVKNVKKQLGE